MRRKLTEHGVSGSEQMSEMTAHAHGLRLTDLHTHYDYRNLRRLPYLIGTNDPNIGELMLLADKAMTGRSLQLLDGLHVHYVVLETI